jgi:hypothetical protein
MNKKLFDKVKSLCKDTGLSEKYLKAITEKLGGSVEDDSTDEAAIETAANLVADVAKESQAEATKWAQKQKDPKFTTTDPDDDSDPDDDPDDDPKKRHKGGNSEVLAYLKKMEKKIDDQATELATMKAERAKGERTATIQSLMAAHKIPQHLQARLAKSISDDEDAETVIKSYKQELITNGLATEDPEGSKAASEKQIDEAADNLLESITVKD